MKYMYISLGYIKHHCILEGTIKNIIYYYVVFEKNIENLLLHCEIQKWSNIIVKNHFFNHWNKKYSMYNNSTTLFF